MKRSAFFRSALAILLCLAMVLPFVPIQAKAAVGNNFDTDAFEGLKLSILGDSISTFEGVSNNTSYNSTLGDNIVYYWKNDAQATGVDVQSETWWQQTIDTLGMSLCVNNSYSGSCMASSFNGDPAAYVDRCVQLHNKSNVNPDIIAFYMGTNDCKNLTSTSTMGTVDAAKKMTASSTPSTILEAYSVMLQKSMAKYPDAEFYCFTLLPQQDEEFNSTKAAYDAFNSGVAALAEHCGAYVVDLYNNSGIHTDKLSRDYFLANDLHPNVAGMDAITACFISELMEHSKYMTEETFPVSYDLANAYVADCGKGLAGDLTQAVAGKPFALTLAGEGEMDITVTMGGKDITAEAVSGNSISIEAVTGPVSVTALELDNYYWKAESKGLYSGSAFDADYTYNNLTKLSGTYSGATFNSTGVQFQMAQPINLLHDRPWVMEFEAAGNWTNGSLLFSYTSSSSVSTNTFLYRTTSNNMLTLGYRCGSVYEHYGVNLSTNVNITPSATHVYRLENRLNEDGTNSVYLSVDGGTAHPMVNHYDGATNTGTTANELSGRDLTFRYMGTSNHPLRNGTLNWVKVWENGEPQAPAAVRYRWEPSASGLVSVEDDTYTENPATLIAGSSANGTQTDAVYALNKSVKLVHDRPWSISWRSKGDWVGDGMLLADTNIAAAPYASFVYNNAKGSCLMGWYDPAQALYVNYGVDVTDLNLSDSTYYTYTLRNKVTCAEDGSYAENMVYLYVDGEEVGPMTACWPNGTANGKTDSAISGKDFTFNHLGKNSFELSDVTFEYIEMNTACIHDYAVVEYDANCQHCAHSVYTCKLCGNSYKTYADEQYSDWQEAKPDVADELIETKTQYRYADCQTKTSYETSMEGYELVGSEWVKSGSGSIDYVDSWPSGFDTTNALYTQYNKKSSKITASETETTKTEIDSDQVAGYLYYHWCYTDSYFSVATKQGSYTTFHAYYSTTNPSNFTCDTSDMSYKAPNLDYCLNSDWFFVAEVNQQNYSNYRKLFTYGTWGEFSDWSDTAVTASDSRKVETRTMYRYMNAPLGDHDYVGVTTDATCVKTGKTVYTCSICGDSYTEEIPVTGHKYVNKVCSVCGEGEPAYYLFGWINGANYACEEDYENMGSYKFEDGKLTATFSENSYIGIKTEGNGRWYMTKEYVPGDTATFYNTSTGSGEKMFVPGGMEITFTLTYNSDDTITLSYVGKECIHSYEESIITAATCTTDGQGKYTCSKCGDSYEAVISALGHKYERGQCVHCGDVDESYVKPTYCLFGYINGQDYGSEADFENRGEFRFEEGKLVVTFQQNSYVAVKIEGNSAWYMAKEYVTGTTAVLYNTNTGSTEKMFVPRGMEITFTLEETPDDTLTLSYTATPCKHNFQDEITTEPGCETTGLKIRTCAICAEVVEEEIPATGHNYKDTVVAPGCLTAGYTTHTCENCGDSYDDTTVAATGHDYEATVTTEPSCITTGIMTYKCTKCNNQYTGQIAATGHSYDEVVTKPGCVTGGYTTHTCSGCGDVYITDQTPAAGHDYRGETTVRPSCEKPGVMTYTCITCGDNYDTELEAMGHNYISEATAPTCTESGFTTHKCTICGNSYADTLVPATGHNYVDGKCQNCGEGDPALEPAAYYLFGYINGANYACEEDYENMGKYRFKDGKLVATFKQDSYIAVKLEGNAAWYMTKEYVNDTTATFFNTKTGSGEKMFVPRGMEITFTLTVNQDDTLTVSYVAVECEHNYLSTVTTEAGCETEGEVTHICTKCDDTYTTPIDPAGHSYRSEVTKPTCTEKGYTTYTCRVCGDTYKGDEVAAAGHKLESQVAVEPGCETVGKMTYTCSVCDYSYSGTIDPSGHDYLAEVTKPGCETQGYTTYTCSKCGKSYVDNQKPAAGHSYKSETTIIPDCETDGQMTYTCEVCGSSYTQILEATGHNFISEIVKPTCTENGYTIHTCSICGYSHSDNVVPAPGHFLNVVTVDPTCTEAGSITSTCNTCGEVIVEEIPAKGHTNESTVVTDATCTETGLVRHVCGICGASSTEEIPATGHSFVKGICTNCGEEDPDYVPTAYYLFGYINGANYACEEDHENMGSYKFENGKLVTTFTEISYVAVKTEGNAAWYMTEGWQGEVTSVTLFDSTTLTEANKLQVPANVEVTFTLTENADGSLTLSYTAAQCDHAYDSQVTTDPTCTEAGVKTFTCSKCGHSYTEEVAATGHSFADGSCTVCGAKDPDASVTSGYVLVTDLSQITSGGQFVIVINNNGTYQAMDTTIASGKFSGVEVTVSDNVVIGSDLPVWDITATEDGVAISVDGSYLSYKSSTNFALGETAYTFNVEEGFRFNCSTETRGLYYNISTGKFGAYANSNATNSGYVADLLLYKYQEISTECNHNYVDGICSICGAKDPNASVEKTYYLFGYINGSNYACEEDYENMGQYKFENGVLTATFTEDSYVAVKTEGNGTWYMTDGWQGNETTFATLYDSTTLAEANKLFVPGGVEVTFVLADNEDGTLTLSYTTAVVEPSKQPTIALKYPTLVFEDVIMMNVYFAASDLGDVTEMGLVTYTENVASADVSTANAIVPGYTFSEADGLYYATTNGIAAKDLGDEIYFAVYAKLADGTYYYTRVVSYSPSKYAYASLSTGSASMKPIVVAMLNYGSAAQTYFNYKTDSLVNANLTDEQKALVEDYRSDMITAVSSPSAAKQGALVNNGGFSRRYPTVSFEGAFCINYYCVPATAVKSQITLYYWDQLAYDTNEVLTTENATAAIPMELNNGEYHAAVEGIAAKDLSRGVYVAFVYSDGTTTYSSGVLAYSIGTYCSVQAGGTGATADLAKATAVYGYYANELFNK